jgi:electron transfer flavoprotein-quinone oxidoreductase
MKSAQQLETVQLMESFKERGEISRLIEGAETVEYSAHSIPEGGINSIARLFGDGILVVGDAAGFALNMGIIVRGMDLAIASGSIAAEAIKSAKQRGDYSSTSLSRYEAMLKDSFVLKDLHTFRNVWKVLNNPRLFEKYPGVITALLKDLMWVGSNPKQKLSSTVLKHLKGNIRISTLKDAFAFLKL